MILTGPEIVEQYKKGAIQIEPGLREEQVNPNSYDVRLSSQPLLEYAPTGSGLGVELDCRKSNPTRSVSWLKDPQVEGLCRQLHPGRLYLASTFEKIGSTRFVPVLDGKSSLARLGVSIHQTAGFGETGFYGAWTLEITVVYPTVIYAGMKIGQMRFHVPQGKIIQYTGRYSNYSEPVASKHHEQRREDENAWRPFQ